MLEVTFDPKTGKAVWHDIDRNDPANIAAFWKAHGGGVVAFISHRLANKEPPPKGDPAAPNDTTGS
jgi:hypothetical protein